MHAAVTALPDTVPAEVVDVPAPRVPRRAALLLARDLVALTRPYQWVKNLVVPLPLLLASTWTAGSLARAAWATVLFTLAAAVVYVGNDVADRDRDRQHPAKRHRPVAAGRIPVPVAAGWAGALAAALVVLVAGSPPALWWPVALYLAINVAYSAKLKHLPVVEVFIVASGFVLRLVQGYLATGDPTPVWLVVCVLCLCLLLGFGKRRAELAAGAAHRPALAGYSVQLLEHLIQLNAVLVITTYLLYLYGQAPLGPYAHAAVLVSAPFGLFAVFRYLQVMLVGRGGGDPVRILVRDRPMVANSLLWGLVLGAILVAARFPGLAASVRAMAG
jgi:decaprenyl-phosphate phosphoribosyltransferase